MPSKMKRARHLAYRKKKGWKPLRPSLTEWQRSIKMGHVDTPKLKKLRRKRKRLHRLERRRRAHLRRQHS